VCTGVVLVVFRMRRHVLFGDGFDAAVIGNVLWRMSNLLDTRTAMTGGHYLSTHASLIVLPFLPVFRFAPSLGLPLIYVAQQASLLLVPVAVNQLSGHFGFDRRTRTALVAALCLSPGLFIAGQLDINEPTLAVGPLAMGVSAALRDRPLRTVGAWFAVAAAARTEVAVAVVVVGVLLGSVGGKRQAARWVVGIGSVASLVWLAWLLLNPLPATPESIAAHFGHLGETPLEVLGTAVSNPLRALRPIADPTWVAAAFFWLLPFGVLPALRSPWWLLGAAPLAGVAVAGVWKPADSYFAHYWYPLLAVGAVAAVDGLGRSSWLRERTATLLGAGVVSAWAIVVATGILPLLVPPGLGVGEAAAAVRMVRESGASYVSVPENLATRLVDVPVLTPFPRPFRCVEEGVGPYTAPSVPPEIIVADRAVMGELREDPAAPLEPLLAAYEAVDDEGELGVWALRDAERAARAYRPCSESVFSPNGFRGGSG